MPNPPHPPQAPSSGSSSAPSRRCTALRADGQPCRAWAVRTPAAAQTTTPALCAAHRTTPLALAPRPAPAGPLAQSSSCPSSSSSTLPPLLYGDFFSDEELAALSSLDGQDTLEDEVRLTRVALRRLLADFGPPGRARSGRALESRALLLFRGAETVAQLLLHQRALQAGDDGLHPAIEAALDALGEEFGIPL